MRQESDKIVERALEIYVVLPERVIRIDDQVLAREPHS